jgi:hypothetical protein
MEEKKLNQDIILFEKQIENNKDETKFIKYFDYLKNFKGKLINSANGHPLAGLVVEVDYNEPYGSEDKLQSIPKEVFIGNGISNENGNFHILLEDTRLVRQYLWLLDGFVDTFLTLNIKDKKGKLYHSVKPQSGPDTFPTTIMIDLPEVPISQSIWSDFAKRLERSRIFRLREIAKQLVIISDSQSIFSDWDLETRHTIINEIERSYLDPKLLLKNQKFFLTFYTLRSPYNLKHINDLLKKHMSDYEAKIEKDRIIDKSEKVGNIFAVNDSLDTDKLKGDNPELVLVYGNENETVSESPFSERDPHNLLDYRDYLRIIYTGPMTSGGYLFNLNRLKNRFHQDFETSNTNLEAANEILIPIVKDILITQNGQVWNSESFSLGFDIDPNSIKPRIAQQPREYLDYLISFSGLAAKEFGLRYRLNLERPDFVLSSLVEENIATLQSFYRDGFQDSEEFVQLQVSAFVVPAKLRGKAPFFLYYEEWLQKIRPFFGENHYPIKVTFTIDKTNIDVKEIKEKLTKDSDQLFLSLIDAEQNLIEGNKYFNRSEYKTAIEKYNLSLKSAVDAYWRISPTKDINSDFVLIQKKLNEFAVLTDPLKFQDYFHIHISQERRDVSPSDIGESIKSGNVRETQFFFSIFHLIFYILPICLGDCATAMGDFPEAMLRYSGLTGIAVAMANSSDSEGYFWLGHSDKNECNISDLFEHPDFEYFKYDHGSLPYSFAIGDSGFPYFAGDCIYYENILNNLEKRFFRIRHGDAILEWADTLYRTDEPSNIARARELYKAILYLHGDQLPTNPDWNTGIYGSSFRENPVIEAQKNRAIKALYQIDLNLNYYGENDEIVPTLRYKVLKEAADRFASRAKLSQTDFLSYMDNLETAAENALRDGITYSNMLKKANLQLEIADEQIKNAEYNVGQAKKQVTAIEAAIEAKRKDLEEKDSFWGEVKDFGGEMLKSITSLKSLSSIGAGGEAAIADAVPIAAFYYYGIKAMVTINEERNRVYKELKNLDDEALPAAKMLVDVRNRELRISNLNREIVQADVEVASDLLTALKNFEENRFLNIELWAELSRIMKRIMRRYLELGTRYAWLAERALSFDQDREIDIIKLDYFPSAYQGILGSDLLLLDLAELDAKYLSGLKDTIPIKHTFSLFVDFPLAFAQLKKSGRCTFQTSEKLFQNAYPGFYSYRIRSVITVIQTLSGRPEVRGILRNIGVSFVSRSDGRIHKLVREPEATAISEFSLKEDMTVYGLPDECLFAFEGSGLETQWTFEFPLNSNLYHLNDVADISVTFDLRAYYSPDLHMKHVLEMPKSIQRMILISASKQQPAELEQLKSNDGITVLKFDMNSVGLSIKEKKRTIKNLMVLIPSKEPISGKAVIYPTKISYNDFPHFEFKDGLAVSDQNSKLSKSIGLDLPQHFELHIEKGLNPNVDFSSVIDVILGVEYEGNLED